LQNTLKSQKNYKHRFTLLIHIVHGKKAPSSMVISLLDNLYRRMPTLTQHTQGHLTDIQQLLNIRPQKNYILNLKREYFITL